MMTHIPCYRADGAKVAVKQRALGGHALYGYRLPPMKLSSTGIKR